MADHEIEGYQFFEEIGRGGSGIVYRALELDTERYVAIKVITRRTDNPSFVKRFNAEAHVIARLEHPHIVPLYNYRREPGKAYLIMRYVNGQSLRQRLIRHGPLDRSSAVRVMEHVISALTYAHKRNIIHRDLKPGNILVDEDENFYLADFAIAVTPAGTLAIDGIATPSYAAPEQWKGKPASAQSDIYSLGITLYELLTGTNPFRADELDQLMRNHLEHSLSPITELRPDLPNSLDVVLQRATAKDPASRYSDVLSLALEFTRCLAAVNLEPENLGQPVFSAVRSDEPASEPTTVLADPVNPYLGLRAFQEADSANFFGRSTLVTALVARLGQQESDAHFLAIVGASGSGKSSIVYAGLFPELRRGALLDSQNWQKIWMQPGSEPFDNLASALTTIATQPVPHLIELMRGRDDGITRAIDNILPDDDSQVLIFIDQFEEVFTQVENEALRAQFLNRLAKAVSAPHTRLRIIIALRADFYDRPLLYPRLAELIRKFTEVIIPPTLDELRIAIERPALQAGLFLENGLVDTILSEIGERPSSLPLLQYALSELYERREGNQLTLRAYRSSGGISGALTQRAEAIFSNLDDGQREIARQVFLRLIASGTDIEDSRQRVKRSELASPLVHSQRRVMWDKNAINIVLDAFGKYRLLTFDYDPVTRSPNVEIAHEVLIRTWERLRAWINESRDDLRIRRRLSDEALEWADSGRDPGFLAMGTRLDELESWTGKTTLALTAEEMAYVEASLIHRAARLAQEQALNSQIVSMEGQVIRRRRLLNISLIAIFVVVIVAVGVGFLAVDQSSQIVHAQQTLVPVRVTLTTVADQISSGQKLNEALRLSALANTEINGVEGNSELASLLAIRALRIAYVPLADKTLMQAEGQIYTKKLFPQASNVQSVAFIESNNPRAAPQQAVVGGADGSVRLLDLASGKSIRQFEGHTAGILDIVIAPDHKTMLTASSDATMRLWDIGTGALIRQFTGHSSDVTSAAFSPDGKLIVSGSTDKTARLWDADTGQIIRQFLGHTDGVYGVAFSPDGKYVATVSQDQTVRLWDADTALEIREFAGNTDGVLSVTFSPDGTMLLTAGRDHIAWLWDVQTGKLIRRFVGHSKTISRAVFSLDTSQVFTASLDGTIRLWDTNNGQLIRQYTGHTADVLSLDVSADGKTFITGSADQTARWWDISQSRVANVLTGYTDFVAGVAFSPDGKWVVTASGDHTAWLWNLQTRQPMQLIGHTSSVVSAVFSPDGKYILTGSLDNTARLWDASTGQPVREFSGHSGIVYGATFSPDGKTIVTASLDKTARLWDTQTGRLIRVYSGHTGGLIAAVFSHNGKMIATASEDFTARVWDVDSGQVLQELKGHQDGVIAVAFSPDDKTVLTGAGDNKARLFDVQTGKLLREFSGHSSGVWAVAFSPDGKTLATASYDYTARLWSVDTGEVLREFVGHTNGLLGIAFSPDGKTIITGSEDMTARLWAVDYHSLLDEVCNVLPRDLSDDEYLKYNIQDKTPTCPGSLP